MESDVNGKGRELPSPVREKGDAERKGKEIVTIVSRRKLNTGGTGLREENCVCFTKLPSQHMSPRGQPSTDITEQN